MPSARIRAAGTIWIVVAVLASPMSPARAGIARPADLAAVRHAPPPQLHVSGDQILDAANTPVQLNGVNRSGAEYACIQGWGFFDGPTDAASIVAMHSWHIHVVRVPLNEDCWLGINLPNPAYGGTAYRQAITGFVHRLENNGMNVILDLHWSAPGTTAADGQRPMADVDHSPAFWRSVALKFGQDQAVLFDLFNEPHDISWGCWLNGCTLPEGWKAAGMQRLVNAVRNAGAKNVLLLGGIGWSGDITEWHQYEPTDPLGQLVAAWHVYNFGGCTDATCWAANVAGVAGAAPVLLGEFGENDCAHPFVDSLMSWADGQGIGYVAWTWDAWDCNSGPALITDYSGAPTTYGEGVRSHFRNRFSD
jgi:endoglucanase